MEHEHALADVASMRVLAARGGALVGPADPNVSSATHELAAAQVQKRVQPRGRPRSGSRPSALPPLPPLPSTSPPARAPTAPPPPPPPIAEPPPTEHSSPKRASAAALAAASALIEGRTQSQQTKRRQPSNQPSEVGGGCGGAGETGRDGSSGGALLAEESRALPVTQCGAETPEGNPNGAGECQTQSAPVAASPPRGTATAESVGVALNHGNVTVTGNGEAMTVSAAALTSAPPSVSDTRSESGRDVTFASPAVPARPEVPAGDAIRSESGRGVTFASPVVPALPEVPAGDTPGTERVPSILLPPSQSSRLWMGPPEARSRRKQIKNGKAPSAAARAAAQRLAAEASAQRAAGLWPTWGGGRALTLVEE